MSNMKAIYYDYNLIFLFKLIRAHSHTLAVRRHPIWPQRALREPIHKSYTIINYMNIYLFIYSLYIGKRCGALLNMVLPLGPFSALNKFLKYESHESILFY